MTNRATRPLLPLAAVALTTACAPVFSELQSARLAGPGRVEVTPSATALYFVDDDGTEHVENHYGVQIATGVRDGMDMRLRYVRVPDAQVNVAGFGPKLRLWRDRLAVSLPVGFAFGEDVDLSETWETHPTLLYTQPLGRRAEATASAKLLLPLTGDDRETLWAMNLGFGLGNPARWLVRPEVGVLFNPGEEGHYLQASIGLTLFTERSR